MVQTLPFTGSVGSQLLACLMVVVIVKQDLLIGMLREILLAAQIQGLGPVEQGCLIIGLEGQRSVEVVDRHLKVTDALTIGVEPSDYVVDDWLIIQNLQGLLGTLQGQDFDIVGVNRGNQRNVMTQQGDKEPRFRHWLGKSIFYFLDQAIL